MGSSGLCPSPRPARHPAVEPPGAPMTAARRTGGQRGGSRKAVSGTVNRLQSTGLQSFGRRLANICISGQAPRPLRSESLPED